MYSLAGNSLLYGGYWLCSPLEFFKKPKCSLSPRGTILFHKSDGEGRKVSLVIHWFPLIALLHGCYRNGSCGHDYLCSQVPLLIPSPRCSWFPTLGLPSDDSFHLTHMCLLTFSAPIPDHQHPVAGAWTSSFSHTHPSPTLKTSAGPTSQPRPHDDLPF